MTRPRSHSKMREGAGSRCQRKCLFLPAHLHSPHLAGAPLFAFGETPPIIT